MENQLDFELPNEVSQRVNELPPPLAAYTDYRKYLKDFYDFKKRTQSTPIRAYSYATFSAAADIKSPNYLKLIIDGQRNLSPDMVKKFARALQLSREESDEFELLVFYSQAQDPLERNKYLKNLSEFRVRQQIKAGQIKTETWNKVPSWVTWVLYALTDQNGAQFNIDELRDTMKGRASLDEIKRSLANLIASGELKTEEGTGAISKGRLLMQGSNDIPVALVRKLQAELIYLGLESLFQDEATDREFGALTIALTEEEFEHLKFELRQMRKRLYKDYSVRRESSKGDRVFQLNIQLFPLTKRSKLTPI